MPGRYNWPEGHELWTYNFYDQIRDYCTRWINDNRPLASEVHIRIPVVPVDPLRTNDHDPYMVGNNTVGGWSFLFTRLVGGGYRSYSHNHWRHNPNLPSFTIFLIDTTARFTHCPRFRPGSIRTIDEHGQWRYAVVPQITTQLGSPDADPS